MAKEDAELYKVAYIENNSAFDAWKIEASDGSLKPNKTGYRRWIKAGNRILQEVKPSARKVGATTLAGKGNRRLKKRARHIETDGKANNDVRLIQTNKDAPHNLQKNASIYILPKA